MFVQSQMPDFPGKDLDDIGVGLDFVGVNYYTRHLVRAPKPGTVMDGMNALLKQLGLPIEVVPEAERGNAVTEMGWEVYPDGLLKVLRRVYRHYEPRALVITENGVAFTDRPEPDGSILDESRRAYLESHLEVALRAVQEGVPLEGYFCWALMDNFEWAEGVSKRFGLYHVDFVSQERRLKHSGQWFRDIVRQARNRP
jgi:beta-glucosidase